MWARYLDSLTSRSRSREETHGISSWLSEKDMELLSQSLRRVRKMTDAQLLESADAITAGMQQGFEDYGELGKIDSIVEIGIGLITLQGIVMTMRDRNLARSQVQE